MNLPKLIAGTIFNLIGALVLFKSIKTTRSKGFGDAFIDMIAGVAFILIGLLILTGYIS